MSTLGSVPKDPSAVLDYLIDWSSWLRTGETITAATWTVESGLTEDSEVDAPQTATIWLSGGTAGVTYTVTCQVVTSDSRTDQRSFDVVVVDR